jgi:parallel beta-helix repeat protein
VKHLKKCYLFFIFLAVLIFTAKLSAQEGGTPEQEFPIGTFVYSNNAAVYDTFNLSGMNYMVSEFNDFNLGSPTKLIGFKNVPDSSLNLLNWVFYYSSGYYTRWEAERNSPNNLETGLKHNTLFGQFDFYQGDSCWSSIQDIGHKVDSLIWGPNYKQDKTHKWWGQDTVLYRAKYRLAFTGGGSLNPDTVICTLKVIYKWKVKIGTQLFDDQYELGQKIIKKSDFPDTNFRENLFVDYDYRSPVVGFRTSNGTVPDGIGIPADTIYIDDAPETGIEFRIEYEGIGKLYVDYIEVYDQLIWEDYIIDPNFVRNRIRDYCNHFTNWDKESWFAYEEPNTLDNYTPFRIVDSIIQYNSEINVNNKRPLSTIINPHWSGMVNGDMHLKKFMDMAKPNKLIIDWFPFWVDEISETGIKWLQEMFQDAHEAQSGFWYVPQAFGEKAGGPTGLDCWVRKPSPNELNASIMLALAHGSKGILPWMFSSSLSSIEEVNCYNQLVYFDAIVDSQGNPSELFHYLKNSLVPRLKGKLGKKLLQLQYTGENIIIKEPLSPTIIHPYLSIVPLDQFYYWNIGFLEKQNHPDDNYFLITDLRTSIATGPHSAELTITNASDHSVRFTDIEGGVDTTIGGNSSLNYLINMIVGDGKLFQVASVIKYGGRLIYNESTSNGITLYDDMIIENGAVLSINGTYNASGNIIIKNGSIVYAQNSKINFLSGKKLIIEGNAVVQGTSSNKLVLDFMSISNNSGIEINGSASLAITNCIVKNAAIGINSLFNANRLTAHYIDFEDCGNNSIIIEGKLPDDGPLTPPPSEIYNCSITGSVYGISVSNLSEIVIKDNTITNTDLGIFLSNVTNPFILRNSLTSTKRSMPGITLLSSNGIINSNHIDGHSNGIYTGNSYADIGANEIYDNQLHGIYIGSGSFPNMSQEPYNDPPHIYPVSGYNQIYNNGGWTGTSLEDDDGSEIYLNFSDVLLTSGCNVIMDGRIPDSAPLVNTQLLMNGIGSDPFEVYADGNCWGEHQLYPLEDRFGNLTVYYDPIVVFPCDLEGGSDDGLFITTLNGEVIDTFYAVPQTTAQLSSTDLIYSAADGKFISADYNAAEILYNQIISGSDPLKTKLHAYKRLYEIGKIKSKPSVYFENLYSTFSSISQSSEDQLMKKIFKQLGSLSLIGKTEYISAIEEFDNVIQQNPNTEEAVYAEIDAITTALFVEEDSTTLNKSAAGKYTKSIAGGYFNSLDKILRTNFSSNQKPEQIILPKEYLLYQNYPNPFNPVTIIRYDIPDNSVVEVSIYDVLGRHIKTLVRNEVKQPGTYEVRFDASGLSSGIYFYRLTANTFVSTKKMMVIK